MTIKIQKPTERFVTDVGWLDSKHSFNFGNHWSPEHEGHGLLLASDAEKDLCQLGTCLPTDTCVGAGADGTMDIRFQRPPGDRLVNAAAD